MHVERLTNTETNDKRGSLTNEPLLCLRNYALVISAQPNPSGRTRSMWFNVLTMWFNMLTMWFNVLTMWFNMLTMWFNVLTTWNIPDRPSPEINRLITCLG